MTLVERLSAHSTAEDRGHDTPCHVWRGALINGGYGRIAIGSRTDGTRRQALAHRVAWETAYGPIPKGLEIDHLCRVRACVNPAHMEPVTHQENCRRAFS